MNHCFISYSNRDADDFGPKLAYELEGGYPFIDTWFDKRDILPGKTWDEKVPEAIQTCKCLLFVMTTDSIAENSICADEWDLALRYKKPIVILRLQTDIEPPFRLGKRQWIDISSNFKAGMAKLRQAIQRLDSPEGQLELLKDRFADAKRDLNFAKSKEDKLRTDKEIEDLKAQIQRQEKIVANPQAAQEQTQKNIEAGLERERQPEKPVAAKITTRFINPPPGIAPPYFQDRLIETKQAVDFLNDDAQRLMTIVGRGGVGKTAMVCRLLKGLESGELPNELGGMKTEGIVYLSETGSHRANFANIFYDLCKLLPAETAQQLDTVYKNPQASTESKMHALLEHFPGGRIVLLLDNFETQVDTESFVIRDAELDEALRAFLNGTHTSVNIIITTRVAPRTLNLIQPGRQRVLTLDEGLDSPYAENILREMDADGRLGLKNANDELLNRARERTRGYPRALEALFAILVSDRYTTLEELLAIPTPENVVEVLVGEAFSRLDVNAQKVMQALAAYNRPVAPAAVDYLLAPHLPAIDSAPILQRLANMHFARRESGKFYLHPVDREYAFGLIPEYSLTAELQRKETEKSAHPEFLRLNTLNKHDMLTRAADYFAHARKPRTEWKKLDDLAAQLAEFDLRCAAGDYDTAADVLEDIDFDYLFLWGHHRLMIDLHLRLKDKITDNNLHMGNLNGLGLAHWQLGQIKEAIMFFERGLEAARESKNRSGERTFLGNLGTACAGLGNTHKAIEFYEQGLAIAHEFSDRNGEGATLNNLGNCYADLGDARKAIEFHGQAFVIAREISNRKEEGIALGNLGIRYADMGDARKAIELYEQALFIEREIGDRSGESIGLENIGHAFLHLEDCQKAMENYSQSIQIADNISFPQTQNQARWGLAQDYLFQNDLNNALTPIEAALQYDVPKNNHNATLLHGIIALRQGDTETASKAFIKSIAQADEILAKTPDFYEALDAKGLALAGTALCRGLLYDRPGTKADTTANRTGTSPAPTIDAVIEIFRAARRIAPHAGIVKRVLRLFDELVKCDAEGALKDVRKAIEGKG